jgi:uncharacterized membrane protein
MTDAPSSAPERQRIILIDVARGLALAAMAIYHFTWDLEFFGYVERGTAAVGGWKIFARLIAGSFLFLVGVSLVLGHGNGIRWRSFGIRLAMIAAAAALITIATYVAIPDRFIFFGILHNIAVSSVMGLLFVRLPAVIGLVAGLVVLFAGPHISAPFFNYGPLLWLGLSTDSVLSNDYVPVFPWTGVVLLGVGAAKLAAGFGLFAWLASIYRIEKGPGKPLAFAGRHSLAVYLLHQPVLIGLVFLASLVYPATVSPEGISRSCNRTCVENNSAEFCMRYCQCVVDELVLSDLLQALPSAQSPGDLHPDIRSIIDSCSVSAGSTGGTE